MTRNILIILGSNFHNPIKQIDQYLPEYLSKSHRVLVFEFPQFKKTLKLINGKLPLIEKINPKLTIFHSFGLLPFARFFYFINFINHKFNFFILKKIMQINLDYFQIITFTPEAALLPNLRNKVIYHILDDYSSLDWWNNPLSKIYLKKMEIRLLKHTSLIITISPFLIEKYKKYKTPIILFPTPANTIPFYSIISKKKRFPSDLEKIPNPIIGFIGSSTIRTKIDWNLIKYLVDLFPNYSFVFIGLFYKNKSRFPNSKNLFNLGYKKSSELPDYVNNFDVCLIPYLQNNFGKSAYPVKIMEYLALGKPVVTTKLPSLTFLKKHGNLIYTAATYPEFAIKLNLALEEKKRSNVLSRIKTAKKYSWENKIKEYQKILDFKYAK